MPCTIEKVQVIWVDCYAKKYFIEYFFTEVLSDGIQVFNKESRTLETDQQEANSFTWLFPYIVFKNGG